MSEKIEKLEDIQEQIRKEIKVDAEGKGYASIRAVARLCGINHTTLLYALDISGQKSPSKLAQLLITQRFEVVKFAEEGIPDIAISMIVKFYAWMNGNKCTKQAQQTDVAMSGMGTRVYLQKLAGWKPSATTESVEEFITRQLPMVANVWELRFPPIFWEKLNRVYGLKRGDQGCAMFLKTYIYGVFPKEVLERLEEVNPANENGNRPHKIHQHLNGIFLTALVKQIEAVMTLLDVASDKNDFKQLAKRLKTLRLVRMPSTKSLPSATQE